MIKLILIILIGVLSIVIIKQLRPEYSFLTSHSCAFDSTVFGCCGVFRAIR